MHLDDLRYVRLDFPTGYIPPSTSVIFNDISGIAIAVNIFCGGRGGEDSFESLSQVRYCQ
jgi:hypothetical protein